MLLRGLHIASRQLFYLLVIGIVLGFIGLLSAIWISAEVSKRTDEIAAWASTQTGYPVEVDSAGLYLLDLIPQLQLDGLRVYSKNKSATLFDAGQVFLSLDLLKTIHTQSPVIADIKVHQVHIDVLRDQQGSIRLAGMVSQDNTQQSYSLKSVLDKTDWLQKVQLADIQLNFQDKKQQQYSGLYQLQQGELTKDDKDWSIQAMLILPAQLGGHMTLKGQFALDNALRLTRSDWLFSGENLQPAALSAGHELHGVQIAQGLLPVVSGELHQNAPSQLQLALTVELSNLLLKSADPEKQLDPVTVDAFQGTIDWQSDGKAWQVSLPNARIEINQQAWPTTTLKARGDAQGQIWLSSDYLQLSEITSLALLVNDSPEFITQAKPAGDISRLELNYDPEQGIKNLSLRASELGMLPWQKYPGFNNLSFTLNWQAERAQLTFDSHQTSVFAEDWLDEPVYLESISGSLDLHRQAEDWQLRADGLRLWNEDLSIQADGQLKKMGEALDSDIKLTLQDIQINRWKAYVPERILPEDFKHWSADAFVDGRISNGVITMHGDPAAFPFEDAPEKGQFEMKLTTENVQLHYAPDWPDLMKVNGEISGQGNNLHITSQSGQIADIKFVDVTTDISNLVKPKPVLTVSGKLNGSSKLALAFLQKSPLQDRFGQIPEWVNATGNSEIGLKLKVPLTAVSDTDVNGYVTFADSTVTSKAVEKLALNKVSGRLNFSNSGVHAENMTGTFMDRPMTITVSNQAQQTLVNIAGHTAMRQIRTVWPEFVPNFVSGQTDFLSQIVIAEPAPGQFGVRVNVKSDLEGVTIDAPLPLAKVPSEKRPFKLSISEKDDSSLAYHLQFSDWLDGAFSYNYNLDKFAGHFAINDNEAIADDQHSRITGKLDEVDIDEWLAWEQAQFGSATSSTMPMDEIDMSVGKLKWMEQTLHNVRLQAEKQDDKMQANISAEEFKGVVNIPLSAAQFQPIEADLSFLHLQLPEPTADEQVIQTELWPAVAIKVKDLQLDGKALGQLNINAMRTADEWRLKQASLKSDLFSADINGAWTQHQGVDKSQFNIVTSSDDLKGLLSHFGYQEVIEAKQTQMTADLAWPGSPLAFSRATVAGKLDIDVGRGQLLEVEPGAAGRIFGLMSITALPRRLSLDFSELFGKGFGFNAITGEFTFAQGIAQTDDLVMKGDSATIAVNGSVDLVKQTYNQKVKVTPQVSSTLPLAGAVAGGPVGLGVGAAILIFDKIAGAVLDKEIVNVISYQYSLSGPWRDPQLKIINQSEK